MLRRNRCSGLASRGHRSCRLSARGNFKYIASQHPSALVGAHHQKLVVVRKDRTVMAYCGGLDISRNRTPVGWGPSFVWHDIHVKLEGLIARDIEREFVLRWNREKDTSTGSKLAGWSGLERLAQAPVDSSDRAPDKNRHKLQMLRTVSVGATSPDIKRDDIWQGYFRLIGTATRFIYLENQYFYEPALADAVVRQAQAQPDLIVIIMVSSGTDDPKTVYREHCRTMRHEFFRRLFAGLLPARRRVYTPFYPGGLLHSKLALVDDKALSMGSANANPRGFFLDTELNVMLDDADVVTRFRRRLWSHNLGVIPAKVDAWAVADFIAQWDVVAKFNEARKASPEKMVGEGVIPFDPTTEEGEKSPWYLPIPDVSC